MKNKIKIIYILGDGHSGSTILSLILGSHTGIESGGELTAFDGRKRYLLANQTISNKPLCSCRTAISKCEYWSKVMDRLSKAYDPRALEINSNDKERFETSNYGIIKVMLEVSGKRLICDSSKELPRLTRLLGGKCFDVFIVHLIRDARAVAYSYKRSGAWYKSEGLLTEDRRHFYDFDNAARRWQSTNIAAFLECQKRKGSYICIRYEDLIADPKKYISMILERIGLRFEDNQLNFWRYPHHYLGGNVTRLKGKQEIKADISYLDNVSDEEWQRATRLAYDGLKLFGYSMKKGDPPMPVSDNLIKKRAYWVLPAYFTKHYIARLIQRSSFKVK